MSTSIAEPPGLDGVPQPPGFVHVGGDHVAAQDHLLAGALVSTPVTREESPELFFDAPGRRQLVGRVVAGEHRLQPGLRPGRRQRVVAAEQQGSVRPGRVDLAAAALFTLRISLCRTLVTIRFASCTKWNGSTLTLAFGSCSVMAFLNTTDGSIATTSIRFRQAGLRSLSQPRTAAESRPSTIPRT